MKKRINWKRLHKLYKLEEKLVEAFNNAVETNNFPVYYDRWCSIHRSVGNAIINTKYVI